VTTSARIRVIAAAALSAAALAPAAEAATVQQLVVFRDGSAAQKTAGLGETTARVGKKRCRVGASTALAALIRSKIGSLQFHDYGACSRKPRDAAGLYVRSIRSDRAKGANGWVYKVGNRVAVAGAADPAGPFGSGRLRAGAHVTWFYCRMTGSSCQRTLALRAQANGGGGVTVTVSSYDDSGHAKRAAGATVHAGAVTATTAADGTATLQLPPGSAKVWAEAPGMVRSFEEPVGVT
jgi:hypothetical protein